MSAAIATATKIFDPVQIDALREIGNIGVGHAMTALATLTDCTIDMSVPNVGIVPLSRFADIAGGAETLSAGIYMAVEGDAPGHVAFILPEVSACRLTDLLTGMPFGSACRMEELACSALMEVGNILVSSYLVAICELTGLRLLSSPPALAFDMTASILSCIASVFAAHEDVDRALTVVTQVDEIGGAISGYFIFIPEPGSLSVMLRALHMEG